MNLSDMHLPLSIYHQRLETLNTKLAQLKKSSRQMGWIRLFVFVVLAVILIWVIGPLQSPMIFMGSVIGGIVIFMLPLSYHQKIFDSIAFTEALITVNENEIQLKKNLFSDGNEYASESAIANDIDVTGPGSLYQLMNRCVTPYGNTSLTKSLLNQELNVEGIQKRQKAVQELTPAIDLRQDLIAIALLGASDKKDKPQASTGTYFQQWKMLVMVWPFISAIAIGLGFFVHGAFYAIPFLAWLPLNRTAKQVQQLYKEISGSSVTWSSYAKLFKRIDGNNFVSDELVELTAAAHGAHEAIQRLAKISSRWDQRQNGLAIGFMNTLALFDLKCAYDYEQWKMQHQTQLSTWLETIGQLERLNSLATFAFNHPDYSYPTLKTGKPEIEIQNMGHPLITSGNVVTNSIALGTDGCVYVITGSNMSGKSTFLRAIGLNMILAQAGVSVFAASMTFTPLRLLTSFRQSDSVQESTSYFMAELKRLKEIMSIVSGQVASLILLDEILRGTNSEDKSHGSEILLEKLMQVNAVTLLATHDIKLGSLESIHPNKAVNYCFESEIKNDCLTFDYQIRRGIAQNKNATFLMKKMGIA